MYIHIHDMYTKKYTYDHSGHSGWSMIRGITEVEPRNETVRCHGTSRCCSFKRELDILQCCHENMWKIVENCGK